MEKAGGSRRLFSLVARAGGNSDAGLAMYRVAHLLVVEMPLIEEGGEGGRSW